MSRLPAPRTSSRQPTRAAKTRLTTRPPVHLRVARLADHAVIRSLLRAAYRPYAPHLPARVFARYLADLLDLDRHGANGPLLVAEDDGRVVGYAAFCRDAGSLGFDFPSGWASGRALAADPAARGRGVARALIGECERLARVDRSPVFAFHTAGFMHTAISLYDGLGYQRAPRYDLDLARHYGFEGYDAIPVIAYRRDLVPTPAEPLSG